MKTTSFIPLAIATSSLFLFATCSDEEGKGANKSVQELRKEDAEKFAERIKNSPDVTGSLTLNFGDEKASGSSFDKAGCNLIFASVKQKVSLNIVGAGDDAGKRLVISFPHPQDGSKPLAGIYSTDDGARFAANGFIGSGPGALSLDGGTLTITECDKESGMVSLEFAGKGSSLGQATGDLPNFSGSLDIKNLQVVRY